MANAPIRRVRYKGIIGPIKVGQRACIWPLDHPNKERVSNETWALTSRIVEILDQAGVFRTEHSLYLPENHPYV